MRQNSASSGVWAKAAPSPAEKCAEDGAGISQRESAGPALTAPTASP